MALNLNQTVGSYWENTLKEPAGGCATPWGENLNSGTKSMDLTNAKTGEKQPLPSMTGAIAIHS